MKILFFAKLKLLFTLPLRSVGSCCKSVLAAGPFRLQVRLGCKSVLTASPSWLQTLLGDIAVAVTGSSPQQRSPSAKRQPHALSCASAACKRRNASSLPSSTRASVAPPGLTGRPVKATRTGHMTIPFFSSCCCA